MAAARVAAVQAVPLPAAPRAIPALPEWALAAVKAPGPAPPEERERFAVEVVTADGTRGRYGPCSATVMAVVRDQLAPALVGADCLPHRAVEQLPLVGRHRSGAALRIARSAVELALWDLRSRLTETPVVRLLGGPLREDVACYASALGVDVDHPLAADVAGWLCEAGFAGQKWSLPGWDRGEEPRADIARLERLRDAIGPAFPLMVDAKGAWSVDYLRRMAPAMAELGVAWIEEPLQGGTVLPPFGAAGAASTVPVAAGEHAYDLQAQLRWLVDGAADVWQPDVGWHGGLVPSLRTVDLAAALGRRVYPHGGCLVGAVILAGLTNPAVLPAVEYHLTVEPIRQAHFATALVPARGRLPVPDDPGLGTVVAEVDGALV